MNDLQKLLESSQMPTDHTPALGPLLDLIRARYGDTVLAIFLYGSCREEPDPKDGLIDLAVVVNRYQDVHSSRLSGWANAWLPPNVYFAEAGGLKSKYALIDQAGLEHKVHARWDHYFWARFCQPVTRIFTRDESVSRWLVEIQAKAVRTFYRNTSALKDAPHAVLDFWAYGLRQTYGCELRPEPAGHALALIERNPDYWQCLHQAVRSTPSPVGVERWRYRLRWHLRKITGKLMNMARLLKAAGTVSQGIDYVAWKVQRHSGVKVEIQSWMRRHPRLGGLALAWGLWRQGGFR